MQLQDFQGRRGGMPGQQVQGMSGFQVRYVEGFLHDREGCRCAARLDRRRRVLWLSRSASAQQRHAALAEAERHLFKPTVHRKLAAAWGVIEAADESKGP